MNILQRYRDEYSGCEPDPEGRYVKHEDVVKLKEELLAALEEIYRDRYDDDNYVNGKIDVVSKVQTILDFSLQ